MGAEPVQYRGHVGCNKQGLSGKAAYGFLEFTSGYHLPWVLYTELQDLIFAMLVCDLTLIWFLSISLFSYFGMKMFDLCHCMLDLFNIIF